MNASLIHSLDVVCRKHPKLGIVLGGDFNQLYEKPLLSFPLKQIVKEPTRPLAVLDKISTNIAHWFCTPIILPAVGN